MFIMKHLELVHQKEEQKKQEVTLLKKELVDISRELEEAKRVNREIFEMFEKYN